MSTNRSNNNRRRGRGNNRGGPGGGGIPGNRIDSRARGNAPQMLEKFRKMAHDASLNDDRVQTEYYLQFADHYFRVLADSKAPKDELRRDGDYGDEYGREDEGGYYERTPEPRLNGGSVRAEHAGPRGALDGDRQGGDRQAGDRQAERPVDRNADRQADRQPLRQADRRPDRQFERQAEPPAGTRSDDDEWLGDGAVAEEAAPVENPFIRDTIARAPRGRPRRRPEMKPEAEADAREQGENFALDASSLPPPIARGTEGDAGTQLDAQDQDAPAKPARAARGMKPRTPRPRTRAARPVDNGVDDGDAEPREAVS